MATVKFILQSKGNDAQIYLRLSLGRGMVFKKRTGLSIDAKGWDSDKGLPKTGDDKRSKITFKLRELETYVLGQLQDADPNLSINGNWLGLMIDRCKGKVDKNDNPLVVEQIQFYIDNADVRKKKGGKVGLTTGTVTQYQSFKNLFISYEHHTKNKYRLLDIDKLWSVGFRKWLKSNKDFSTGYIGQKISQLKTVLNDAVTYGRAINSQLNSIYTEKEDDTDRYIQTLSFDEIKQIYNTEMPSLVLENAKKWLIIGCYIGQRKSDLLRITQNDIQQDGKGVYIDITQIKVKTKVVVSISEPYVLDIVLNDFPEYVADSHLGKYFKKVCEVAKINKIVDGYKIIDKRKVFGQYPKHEVISSHTCRRSFATNFYKKIPTAILITITGHTTESMFLRYINQNADKRENAELFLQYYEQMTKNVKPQMTVVKKAN